MIKSILLSCFLLVNMAAFSADKKSLVEGIIKTFDKKNQDMDKAMAKMPFKSEEDKNTIKAEAEKFRVGYVGSVRKDLESLKEKDLKDIHGILSTPVMVKFGSAEQSEKLSQALISPTVKTVEKGRFEKVKKLYSASSFKEILFATFSMQKSVMGRQLPPELMDKVMGKVFEKVKNDGVYLMYSFVNGFSDKEVDELNQHFENNAFKGFYKRSTMIYLDQYKVYLAKVMDIITKQMKKK